MELRRYWEIIWRRKWIFILAILLIPLFTIAAIYSLDPIYKSEAKLKIKITPTEPFFIKDLSGGLGKFDFFDKDLVMGSMEEFITSGPVIKKTIEDMNLKDRKGRFFAPKKFVNPGILNLILFFRKGIGVKNILDTETIQVTGYSNNLYEAKHIAENVIKNILDSFSKMYQEEVEKVIEILESRISEVNQRLMMVERAYADYQTRNKLYSVSSQMSALIGELFALESELNKNERSLESSRSSLLAIKEALAKHPEFHEREITLEDNPLIEDAKKKLHDFEVMLAKTITERTPEHPDVKILKNQIEAVKSAISREIEKTFASQTIQRNEYYDTLVSNYSDAEIDIVKNLATRKVFSEQIRSKENMLKEIPEKEKGLNVLMRERDTLRTTYTTYLANLQTAKSARGMELSNVVIIQHPLLLDRMSDNLHFPREPKAFYLLIAIFMGVLGGLSLIFLLEYLDDRIWNVQEMSDFLGKRMIGIVPRFKKTHLEVDSTQTSPFTESVHNLLLNMKLYKGQEIGKIISIVSTLKGEGKSILASFIAVVLAEQDKKILLIDGNMSNPALHRIFRISGEKGIGPYLAGGLPIQELICSTFIKNLEIIIAGDPPKANPHWYLDSSRFKEIIRSLQLKYDYVIIDTPALEFGSEAMVLSENANDMVLVVEQGKPSKMKIQKSEDIIAATNKKEGLWVVFNKVRYQSFY